MPIGSSKSAVAQGRSMIFYSQNQFIKGFMLRTKHTSKHSIARLIFGFYRPDKPDSWSKGCQFDPGRSGGTIFFSRVSFVCWLSVGVRSIPVLPQWHVKDPGLSVISAGGWLHLNTHTPLTQRSRSGLTLSLIHI